MRCFPIEMRSCRPGQPSHWAAYPPSPLCRLPDYYYSEILSTVASEAWGSMSAMTAPPLVHNHCRSFEYSLFLKQEVRSRRESIELLFHTAIVSCRSRMEDEAKAEAVRRALREAGLSEIASEFDVANLVKLHNGGYTSARCITVAREQDLYQCKLAPALVGLLLNGVGQLAGEFAIRLAISRFLTCRPTRAAGSASLTRCMSR